ncbi:tRNA-splicing endonuclease [Spraguea lophii 42_110]|uniref:tRNA-intron lyase n=1 Tax=Spraguea lophii (strain 42_110) TaxID=1358809 RepID=S7W5B4_SPRLO|nr:tRNA-splicing endonuclease [Spraguea lophii 42_110]
MEISLKKTLIFNKFVDEGFHVCDGLGYGVDFLLYTDEPYKVHSKYAVVVYDNQNYQHIQALQRVCNSVRKTLILVDYDTDIIYYSIKRFGDRKEYDK